MKKQIIIEVICFLFTLLFVYAAVSKLIDYQKFTIQLGQSPMLTKWAAFIAWFIPSLEIIISIMLVFKATRKIALYGALNLMVAFSMYIIIITNFSPYVPCSCGGVLEKLGWAQHLIFNIIFVLFAVITIILLDSKKSEMRGEKIERGILLSEIQ